MSNAIKKERLEVPIWHKPFLTIEEATAYTGIGRDTLREMTRQMVNFSTFCIIMRKWQKLRAEVMFQQ